MYSVSVFMVYIHVNSHSICDSSQAEPYLAGCEVAVTSGQWSI